MCRCSGGVCEGLWRLKLLPHLWDLDDDLHQSHESHEDEVQIPSSLCGWATRARQSHGVGRHCTARGRSRKPGGVPGSTLGVQCCGGGGGGGKCKLCTKKNRHVV